MEEVHFLGAKLIPKSPHQLPSTDHQTGAMPLLVPEIPHRLLLFPETVGNPATKAVGDIHECGGRKLRHSAAP